MASARQARDKKWLQKHNKKSVVARAAIVPHFFSNVERTVSKLWYNLCYAQRGTETLLSLFQSRCAIKKMEWKNLKERCFFSLIVKFPSWNVRGKWRRLWSRERHIFSLEQRQFSSSMVRRCAYWKIVFPFVFHLYEILYEKLTRFLWIKIFIKFKVGINIILEYSFLDFSKIK